MTITVNMLEAKTGLSKLVEAVESGAESEIIIARNGKPAAKLVPLHAEPRKKVRLGLAAGKNPHWIMRLSKLSTPRLKPCSSASMTASEAFTGYARGDLGDEHAGSAA